jgi:protein-export membrane protein SecD
MNRKSVPVIIIIVAIFLAFFVYPQAFNKGADFLNSKLKLRNKTYKIPHFFNVPAFRLGLDLLGGTHLVYRADLSGVSGQSTADAMAGVRDVIERRVNLFGVAEPLVQIEGGNQLVVELAGISDVNQAITMIGQTPFLEFKEELPPAQGDLIIAKALGKDAKGITSKQICSNAQALTIFLLQYRQDPCYVSTGLTGKFLKGSQLDFDKTTYQPQISLTLTGEGAKLFYEITKRNINKTVAIYLDGAPISAPTVQSEIPNGSAVISGRFTVQEAKDLANRLNAGALPVPITLVSQQTIGPSLGQDSLNKSLTAGLYGLLAVALFMIIFYRLPGVISVVALLVYMVIVLTIYKLIPVTLTLAGIAGFILSLGIAVDANVLIFARMREELKNGATLTQAVHTGFDRAWYSIRDSHVTTLLGALVLYIFSTSVVKGFALTLGVGVLMSLFTATVMARSLLNVFIGPRLEKRRWLV